MRNGTWCTQYLSVLVSVKAACITREGEIEIGTQRTNHLSVLVRLCYCSVWINLESEIGKRNRIVTACPLSLLFVLSLWAAQAHKTLEGYLGTFNFAACCIHNHNLENPTAFIASTQQYLKQLFSEITLHSSSQRRHEDCVHSSLLGHLCRVDSLSCPFKLWSIFGVRIESVPDMHVAFILANIPDAAVGSANIRPRPWIMNVGTIQSRSANISVLGGANRPAASGVSVVSNLAISISAPVWGLRLIFFASQLRQDYDARQDQQSQNSA